MYTYIHIYIYIYMHTHTYIKVIKKNESMSFIGKWMELEIMLSELNHALKVKFCMFLLICGT
jgi:hypothetical protein